MSPSLRKRLNCCVAAKYRDGPTAEVNFVHGRCRRTAIVRRIENGSTEPHCPTLRDTIAFLRKCALRRRTFVMRRAAFSLTRTSAFGIALLFFAHQVGS